MSTKALGHEHFDRLTHKLGPRVAENPLGLSIDHDDLAGTADHHHRVWRSPDDQLEAPLAFAQRVGGLPRLARRVRFGLIRLRKQHGAITGRHGFTRINHGFELFFLAIGKRHKRVRSSSRGERLTRRLVSGSLFVGLADRNARVGILTIRPDPPCWRRRKSPFLARKPVDPGSFGGRPTAGFVRASRMDQNSIFGQRIYPSRRTDAPLSTLTGVSRSILLFSVAWLMKDSSSPLPRPRMRMRPSPYCNGAR